MFKLFISYFHYADRISILKDSPIILPKMSISTLDLGHVYRNAIVIQAETGKFITSLDIPIKWIRHQREIF